MQLISETGLFSNFYELLFSGIDQNKEMICILCTYSYNRIVILFLNIYIIYDPLICLMNTLIPILCD